MPAFSSLLSLASHVALVVQCIGVSPDALIHRGQGRSCILLVWTLASAQHPGTVEMLVPKSKHKVL